jgi:putative tryptophan/tyrosine transport system substrate-binding protein
MQGAIMTRRTLGLLLTLALSCFWSSLTAAAPPGKMPRIGVLEPGSPPVSPDWKARSPFFQELRQLGWMEGQNIVVEFRWARGQASQLPPLAAELVQLPVDVIVVADAAAIRAAQHATTTIPIVMISVSDPEAAGFVAELARPGDNITGIGGVVLNLSGKLLELVKEAVPGVTRVAILTPGPKGLDRMKRAAQSLGVSMHPLFVGEPDRFEPAFQEAIRVGAGALVVMPALVFARHRERIAALALQHGLPAIHWSQRFAEVGGLMSYGPSVPHLWQRAAAHVDKILKGAKPAELPVEQPMTFEFVINLKTAQALGLTIPPSVLFQATKMIR